jgi:hypothetical protein
MDRALLIDCARAAEHIAATNAAIVRSGELAPAEAKEIEHSACLPSLHTDLASL